MYQKILVPIDGSAISTRGLDEAIKLAKNQGSQLRLLHVANDRTWYCNCGEGTYFGDVIESTREDGLIILNNAVATARQHGVEAEIVLVESASGPTAALIIAHAKQWAADLIVMGTHGRRGLQRLTMGSDAECVVRNSPVPVLLVRGISKEAIAATKSRVSDDASQQVVYA